MHWSQRRLCRKIVERLSFPKMYFCCCCCSWCTFVFVHIRFISKKNIINLPNLVWEVWNSVLSSRIIRRQQKTLRYMSHLSSGSKNKLHRKQVETSGLSHHRENLRSNFQICLINGFLFSMVLQPFGPGTLFQLFNPIQSR
jgi:hypothetical protein